MAGYLILIYGDERQWALETAEDQQLKGEAHGAFAAAAGAGLLGGHELSAAELATTLRRGPEGRPMITDGPFLETKEAVGGYYLVDVPDLDEAIRLASMLPELATGHCGVEIRPIVVHG